MTDDLVPSQGEALINPEAAVEAIRKAYVRGDANRGAAALMAAALAMTAFAAQRLAAAEDAEAFCRSLAVSTTEALDPQEQIGLDWCVHNCAAVASTLRAMRALAECRFEDTSKLAAEVAKHSEAGAVAWNRLVELEPNSLDDMNLALWVGVLQRLPLMARVFDAQGQAQRHLLLGERQRYLESLQGVLDLIADERRIVVSVHDTFAPVLRQILNQVEQMVRAQREFVQRSLDTLETERFLPQGRKIFIIHGHDEAAWLNLKAMLKEEFDLDTLVLKQEASGTRPLIEKFEAVAAECAFAIALVTPDDLVKKGKSTTLQARPNVLFELGWFYGRLGPGRVTIVKKAADTAMPSDLAGIVTLVYSTNVTEILLDLRKELQAAGMILSRRPAASAR